MITKIKVVKHSSKAGSKAKAFACISGSGCTDDQLVAQIQYAVNFSVFVSMGKNRICIVGYRL